MSGVMALAGASKVFVFEPLPMNQQALLRLCELNPALPISVVPFAISDTDGLGHLTVMPDFSMGKLTDSSFQVEATASGEISVTVRQIDSMLYSREIPPPRVVKIDVEGAELHVLRGATETLRISRPKIFLEAHTAALEKACSERLAQFGYKMCRIVHEVRSEQSVRHLVCLP
jgi:FkbM family methyltransferase